MKKIMRFSKSNVSVSIANLSNGRFIAFRGEIDQIGPDTEFGRKIKIVNSAGQSKHQDLWINFKFNPKNNIWFRDLKSFSIDDIASHFEGDFEVVTVNEKVLASGINDDEDQYDVGSTNAIGNANLDGTSDDNAIRNRGNQSTLASPTQNSGKVVELRVGGGNLSNDSKNGSGIRNSVRPTDGQTDWLKASDSIKHESGQIGDLGRAASTERNGSVGNHIATVNSINSAGQNKKIRVIQNVEAIKLTKLLQSEKRTPTQEEIKVLELYTGWGGLSDVVASGEVELFIGEELSLSEKRHLIDSAFTGYYTNGQLVEAQWAMLVRAGFGGGLVCEPSAGVGRYLSHRPSQFDTITHFTAVEIDEFSAQITKYLHPHADVLAEPFEATYQNRIVDQKYDLVIGNVPFGDSRIIDHNTGDALSIHNYFIKTAVDILEQGGITSIITSTYTMDAIGTELRHYLSEHAQLLSIIRTPEGCFDGTFVMTDIITIRKKTFDERDEQFEPIPFVNRGVVELIAGGNFRYELDGKEAKAVKGETKIIIPINECFTVNHPNAILVGKKSAMSNVGGRPVMSLSGSLEEVIKQLNSINPVSSMRQLAPNTKWFDDSNQFLKNGYPKLEVYYDKISNERLMPGSLVMNGSEASIVTGITTLSGGLYGARLQKYSPRGFTNRYGKLINSTLLIRDYIELRNLVVKILSIQKSTSEVNDSEFGKLLSDLNSLYDTFESKYGLFFDKSVRKILSADSQFGLCLGLTEYDSETDTAKKARIFCEKTINTKKMPEVAETLSDAATISLMQFGNINVELIESLLSKKISTAIADEPGIVFLNPQNNQFEHYTKYLVGNVVDKLEKAIAFKDSLPLVAYNIEPLDKVQPPYTNIKDIEVGMAAGWIPIGVVQDFIISVFASDNAKVATKISIYGNGTDNESSMDVDIQIVPTQNSHANYNLCSTQTWGGETFDFKRVLASAIKGTPISIQIEGVYSDEESRKANQKVELLNREWNKFYKSHEIYSVELEELYNTKVNCYNYEIDFDNIDYQFPDLNTEFIPRKNQKSFVLGAINKQRILNGDPTGGGKTGCEVILAYELKRLGLSKLPVIVVPNHMLYQMTSEAQQIYPSARICMISKSDLENENRLGFIAKLSMNEWDFAVITYGLFKELKAPEEYLRRVLNNQIEALNERADKTESNRERRRILKIISDKIDKFESEIESRNSAGKFIDISHTGIDAIIYDEVHILKNLELDMVDDIAGVNANQGSAIAANEYAKMEYIRDNYYGGEEFGVFGLSATLISNQASELYTLFRQFKPSALLHEGIHNFNQWVAQYGLIENCLEVKPEGKGYQYKLRLAGYKNMPELLSNFRSFTQANLLENLDIQVPNCEEESVVVEPNIWQQYQFALLFERAKNIRDGNPDLISKINSKGELVEYEDILLTVLNDATLASISATALHKWINPKGLNDKLRVAAKACADLYHQTNDSKAAQLIFLDRSVPKIGEWSGYKQLKENLIELGVNEVDVEFIHSAKTDVKRDTLFSKVRNGIIRLLLGSTDKMGTGTNVQRKLIAGHDIDLPWRPDQLIQRYGRVIRSGNLNPIVYWKRYLTKGSMDVFRLETLKRKAAYVAAAMSNPRSVDRIYRPEEKLDFDSMVAAVSENPIIKEKARVESEIKNLEFERDDYLDTKRRLERTINRSKSNQDIAKLNISKLTLIKNYRDRFVAENPCEPTILPDDATKAVAGFVAAYDNAKKARLSVSGVIIRIGDKQKREEHQSGKTTYLSVSAMGAAISHALIEAGEDSVVEASLLGFDVVFSISTNRNSSEYNLTKASLIDPLDRTQVLLTVSHQGSYPGYALTKLIAQIGSELNDNLNTYIANVSYLNNLIKGAESKLSDLPKSFDDELLVELYRRKAEISTEVMKALNDQFNNEGDPLPPIDVVKALYLESDCDPKFNPFTCRVESDLDPNAKYFPIKREVALLADEDKISASLSFA